MLVELKQRLAEALSLSVSVTAVKIRALVAQDFFNAAKFQMDFCENMVLEQHLQQQGDKLFVCLFTFQLNYKLFHRLVGCYSKFRRYPVRVSKTLGFISKSVREIYCRSGHI